MNRFKSGKMFAALLFSFILLITILIRLPAVAAQENKTAPAVAAPDFALQDLQGTNVTLSQFKGESRSFSISGPHGATSARLCALR